MKIFWSGLEQNIEKICLFTCSLFAKKFNQMFSLKCWYVHNVCSLWCPVCPAAICFPSSLLHLSCDNHPAFIGWMEVAIICCVLSDPVSCSSRCTTVTIVWNTSCCRIFSSWSLLNIYKIIEFLALCWFCLLGKESPCRSISPGEGHFCGAPFYHRTPLSIPMIIEVFSKS